jgi:MFS family permease
VSPSTGPPERFRLLVPLRITDFRRLWTGMSISLLGDGIFLVAVAWLVYSLSNAPVALAVVGIAMSLPQALFVLLGGVVSDRVERRHVMIAADWLRFLAIGELGVLALMHALALWQVFALVAIYGTASAFFLPSFDAIVPDIVPPQLLAEANALDQFVRPAALRLAGPALGGFVVAGWGTGGALLIDAVTFAVSALSVAAMDPLPRKPVGAGLDATLRELREGYRYVRSHVWLWGSLLGASIAYLLFTGPADVLLPYVVKNDMHGGAQLLGVVLAFGGVGAVASAVLVGQRGMPRRHMTFCYVTWTIATLAVAGYGLAVLPWQLMLACLVFHAFDTAGLIVWGTTRHTLVPADMRGRVAGFGTLAYGLWPLSYALTAPVAALVGVRATLVGAGLLGGLVTFAFLFLPGMRDIERHDVLRRHAASPARVPAAAVD